MRRTLPLAIAAFLLLGCEVTPPTDEGFNLPDKPPGPGGADAGQRGGRGEPNAQGGPPNGKPGPDGKLPPGAGPLDLTEMVPRKSQDAVRSAEHIMVSGRVEAGICTSPIRIDVIEKKPKRNKAGAANGAPGTPSNNKPSPMGPITALSLEKAGPFDIAVPSGGPYLIAALCDQNKDGKVALPNEPISPPQLLELSENTPITDVVLDLAAHKGSDVGQGGERANGWNTGQANDGKRPPPPTPPGDGKTKPSHAPAAESIPSE